MDFGWLIPGGTGYNVETLQLAITVVVASFDIVVVWFGVWIPLRNAIAPEDRPYMWRGVAAFARGQRLAAESDAAIERMKNARR